LRRNAIAADGERPYDVIETKPNMETLRAEGRTDRSRVQQSVMRGMPRKITEI